MQQASHGWIWIGLDEVVGKRVNFLVMLDIPDSVDIGISQASNGHHLARLLGVVGDIRVLLQVLRTLLSEVFVG